MGNADVRTRDGFSDELRTAVELGQAVSEQTALEILRAPSSVIPEILAAASWMKQRFFGNKVHLCSILNAKSGACPEDCAFCAQSVRHHAEVEVYGLRNKEDILAAYEQAARLPIQHYGIVTSGPTLSEDDVRKICDAIRGQGNERVGWCASLGGLTEEQLKQLRAAGLKRFHHNLETAESFFPSICTTHTYGDRVDTVRAAKAAGLEVCCGGLLGMGESPEQRVELALALRDLEVDSIPLNFIIPVPGTRMAEVEPMKPMDILRSIAMFRMTNPCAEIKVCAGRVHLGDLQSMIFYAGATGMMIGDLLTVAGREVETDLQMLKDLEVDY